MGEPIIIWPPGGGNEGDPCTNELGSGFVSCDDTAQEWAQIEYGSGAWACCTQY